ncbi:MAG: GHKL domain-containing protein [Oscillospiraceae bacterium]|nr:GHKL domain-containing protein [Oscillospiraceae bacterium]MCL2280131.1 GHKL domain-containing protein [Oscillospiraceae bacterium]
MIIQFFAAILLIISVHIVSSNAAQKRITLKSFLPILIAVIVFYPATYIIVPADYYQDVLIISGHAIASVLCLVTAVKNRKGDVLYVAFLFFGLLVTASALVNWVISILFAGGVDAAHTDFSTNFAFFIICSVTSRNGRLIKVTQGLLEKQKNIKILLIATVWTSALLAAFIYYYFQTYDVDSAILVIMAALSVMLMLLLGILFPKFILSSLTGAYYKNLSRVMDEQVRAQVEHYEAMVKANEEIKRFRHDYNNLKVVLTDALRRNDPDSALLLLADDEMSQAESAYQFNTGNIMLDALLNEKQYRASKTNTHITFTGTVPANLLRPIDICIIFGNAMDNAIEACEKCPKEQTKEIAIALRYSRNFLFIEIKNPTAEEVKIINNKIETTKQDKAVHGIGLRSIKSAVGKLGGEMKLDYEKRVFTISIDLDFNSNLIL